ncbi:MAG: enoyl-CoA hydratase/isomerase family protein [Rhodothermales bacterium]|nr:enoyl-CoA hydratase/isomerase family protein [Rhodothermales bacterium]MBO6778505.1 enoyl-CoA hydratase/isomerase family protein [Rhodothermales bacterium]
MDFETLLLEIEDGIAVVTINRPDKLNALNAQVLDDLDACFTALATNDAVRAVVLTGAGEKAFVAGADITQFTRLDAQTATGFALRGQEVFGKIENLGKPVIAAINGFALGGGCEIAIACHMRVASSNARLGQPEVGLGLMCGYGGTQRLPRIVGLGHAMELLTTGAHITAERAHEIGLVNKLVEPGQALAAAREMAAVIARQAPIGVKLSLEAALAADQRLSDGLQMEAELFGRTFDTEDLTEGVSAFLERRKPTFQGR